MFVTILAVIFTSFILTFFLTVPTIKIAKKLGLVDDPKIRPHPAHTHKKILPRAGGLPIFLGIWVTMLFFSAWNQQLQGILLATTLLLIIGLLDDRKDVSPYYRFLTNCGAVFLVIYSGITIPYVTNPLGGVLLLDKWKITVDLFGWQYPIYLSSFLAFLWILWTTNIIGWSGGVDGQLPGFVAISAAIIGILSLRYALNDPSKLYVSVLAFATSGAFLGFLPWNYYPQKIMPGYGGKTLAGFLLGVISILAFSKLGTALLVLAVPMTDAVFMLIKRIISGKSPVRATSDHLHHHLLKLGWSRQKIAIFYWLISLILGIPALTLNYKQKMFTGVLFIVVVLVFIFWINFFRDFSKKGEQF